ncbi:hypothetical protein HZA41_03585 [Candidatus Peregrinibacteria bacterium]|nr:hypothetical protein [Candidatus Peregrinibacteria bacterium]
MYKRKLILGTVIIGIGIGVFVGLQSVKMTSGVQADLDISKTRVVVGGKIAVTSAQITKGMDGIRNFQKNPALTVFFQDTGWNPYFEKIVDPLKPEMVEPTKQMMIYQDQQGWQYLVDLASNQIIQMGPASQSSLTDPTPEMDFTPRYTKKELQTYSVNWLKERNIDVDSLAKEFEFSVGTKDGKGFFFRWTDNKAQEGEMRFLQVGFTIGGSLLSYSNTLNI